MLCLLLASFSSLPFWSLAQETPRAETLDAEDRKRILAEIENLQSTLQSLQQRMNEQRDEIRRLSEELGRATSNKDYATREDFKHLAEKIKEVDDKRIADDAKVMNEFARLGKIFSATLKTPAVSTAKAPSDVGTGAPPTRSTSPPVAKQNGETKLPNDNWKEYTIRMGDIPPVIVRGLAAQGVKITQKQLIEANPNVNWSKLHIGQKILIPPPSTP